MNGRSHTRITHSLTNDLVHSLGPGHSAPPRPSASAHTFITHKKTNDKILPFFSSDFSTKTVGKIGGLSPNEEFLCNQFINNRLQALSKNYPPSRDWFPPFKMDFSDTREKIAAMPARFWAGVPNVPAKKKESMAIYTCFIQHVINSLKKTGKGAIVIPTGFITAKSGIENKILHKIVDDKVVFGCVSMPSNVFANTGTNVSVLFFDKSATTDKVILIDASKLGEEYKDANGLKKVRLNDDEIEKIVGTFQRKEAVEDFSVAVSYDEIKEKGYSLSAGQYFDIKIDYVDITEEEFNNRMANYKQTLSEQFKESHRLEEEIMKQLDALQFNENVGNNE